MPSLYFPDKRLQILIFTIKMSTIFKVVFFCCSSSEEEKKESVEKVEKKVEDDKVCHEKIEVLFKAHSEESPVVVKSSLSSESCSISSGSFSK